jgi:chromosome partitioning protein
MKVIVLASQKGGAGKTTLTAHLAIAAENDGARSVLIDTDPQASLAAWWKERKAETPAFVTTTLKELPEKLDALKKAGIDFVFIDTPPAIAVTISAVLNIADFVLIPTRPSPHDLRAIEQTLELTKKAGCNFGFVLTQAKANSRLTIQAATFLSAHGIIAPAIIHDRVDFAGSMIDGRSVIEIDPKGRSAAEIGELWQFTKARITESPKNRLTYKPNNHKPERLKNG